MRAGVDAADSGARLGQYQIVTALGAGGMNEVYKARDTRLDRVVAIKILPAALHISPRTVENHLTRAYSKLGVSSRTKLALLSSV